MNKTLRIVCLVPLLLLASACATTSNHMTAVPDSAKVTQPAQGKALIVFLRTAALGRAIQSTVYDGEHYIGTLSYNGQIAYQAEPGKHMFMVIGETADFLRAELQAGKTYYAYVIPRMGVWKARFSFRPQNGQIPQGEIDAALRSTKQSVINDEGRSWAQANAADIKSKKDENLVKWESKAEGDKQTLNATSGR